MVYSSSKSNEKTQENEEPEEEMDRVEEPEEEMDRVEDSGAEMERDANPEEEESETENRESSEEGEESYPPGPDPAMFAPPSDVPSLARIFISMLAESAWQNLGLIARPGTTKVSLDLKQVKLAIDSIDSLFTNLSGELEEGEKKEIQGLLTNLRLNFVEKSSPGGTGSPTE